MAEPARQLADADGQVDFDLDAEDVLLAEAVGEPLVIRAGGQDITIPHAAAWPHTANAAAAKGDFDEWARQILSPADFTRWQAAGLRVYQINALFERLQAHTGTSPGKPRRSPRSSAKTRRK